MNLTLKLMILSSSWLIFTSCVSKEAISPSLPEEGVSVPQTAISETWEKEWDKLVASAKKESEVQAISAVGPEVLKAVGDAFRKKFGINFEYSVMRGSEQQERLSRERKAGLYLWDIYIGGTQTITFALQPVGVLEPIEPALVLPEVRNPSAYWNGQLPLTGYGYAISTAKFINVPLLINVELVGLEEIKSYKDLLNPKWKGKIVMDDPTTAGSAYLWARYIYIQNIAGGIDFLKALVKQEPAVTRDRRLLTEWVARGKSAISVLARTEITDPFIQMGAPLKYLMPVEGTYVASGGGNIAVINSALHPNAAKVFLNWVLTKEAGEIWSPAHGAQSSRVDVSTDFLKPDYVRKPVVKYFDGDNEEFLKKGLELDKEIRAIFVP